MQSTKSAWPARPAAGCSTWPTTGTAARPPDRLSWFEEKWARRSEPLCFSGVWRFRELLPFAPPDKVVTIGEGQTLLAAGGRAWPSTSAWSPAGCYLQYEGMNPSGSFKDNGMTAAFTHARMIGARRAACASTGNTSASLALYCCVTQADAGGHLHRLGQDLLRQAVAGARLRRAHGPDRRRLRRRHAARAAGQRSSWASTWSTASTRSGSKGRRRSCSACWRRCAGKSPDWIVVPGGNLGNASAFGKAFLELQRAGADRPRAAAGGHQRGRREHALRAVRAARPALERRPARHARIVDDYYAELDAARPPRPSTIASAIEINRPVNLTKCLRALDVLRRRRPRGDRPGDPRRQGPGRRRRPRLRAGQRRQRRRARKLLREEGVIAPERARRLHPHRPPAQGPDGDGRLSHAPTRRSSTKCSAAAA